MAAAASSILETSGKCRYLVYLRIGQRVLCKDHSCCLTLFVESGDKLWAVGPAKFLLHGDVVRVSVGDMLWYTDTAAGNARVAIGRCEYLEDTVGNFAMFRLPDSTPKGTLRNGVLVSTSFNGAQQLRVPTAEKSSTKMLLKAKRFLIHKEDQSLPFDIQTGSRSATYTDNANGVRDWILVPITDPTAETLRCWLIGSLVTTVPDEVGPLIELGGTYSGIIEQSSQKYCAIAPLGPPIQKVQEKYFNGQPFRMVKPVTRPTEHLDSVYDKPAMPNALDTSKNLFQGNVDSGYQPSGPK